MTASRLIVNHEAGCKWGRFEGQVDDQANIISGEIQFGHSDAAKRFSDIYNLHKAAGTVRGWIAVKYLDGSSNGDVYDSRAEAVADRFPWEDEYFFCDLQQPSMTICAAESILRWRREMARMERAHTDRDAPHGGLEVIPRLTQEDQESQIEAVRTGRGILALGHRRHKRG